MTRLIALTVAITCTAVAAFAATEAILSEDPGVIEIEVAPQDLGRCEETLRQVAGMPAVTDDGTPILLEPASDMPSVVCVASTDV